MNKCHANINWVNDTVPAINDTNLNYMDGCIDTIDTRVVSLDTAKLEAEDVANTITSMTLNGDTGVITCTRYDGSTFTIDTVLEKVVTNFTYDSTTQSLILTLADGSIVSIPLSDFITETEFIDSNTIAFNVSNHVVTAVVKNNSIGDAQMQTGYLTDCQTAKNAAELAATTSNTNRLKSEGFAVGQQDGIDVPSTSPYFERSARYYAEQCEDALDNVIQALNMVTFSVDANGHLLYQDGAAYAFRVVDNGQLQWQVAVA